MSSPSQSKKFNLKPSQHARQRSEIFSQSFFTSAIFPGNSLQSVIIGMGCFPRTYFQNPGSFLVGLKSSRIGTHPHSSASHTLAESAENGPDCHAAILAR